MPETNKVEFKALFDDGRIFTFANPGEVHNVSEVTLHEWNQEFAPAVESLHATYEMVSPEPQIDFSNK